MDGYRKNSHAVHGVASEKCGFTTLSKEMCPNESLVTFQTATNTDLTVLVAVFIRK